MKTIIALLLTGCALTHAQQVGPTASVLTTNVTHRTIVLQVTTTNIVRHYGAPVQWRGRTRWLGDDVPVSSVSVTNAAARPGRP